MILKPTSVSRRLVAEGLVKLVTKFDPRACRLHAKLYPLSHQRYNLNIRRHAPVD